MEKLKIVIILLGLIWFSGCGYIKQTNIESKDIAFSEEETTSIQSDYENYIGTWSEEGKSHESIIYEGGTEFSVEITSDNELNGYLYSQQEISGRFAEIDIICRIEDGECYYPFSDDGWGNSGILYIQFETNVIKISVQDFVMGESNTSGFGIDRTYILSKEEANQNSTEYDGEQKEQLLQYSVDWSEDQILDEIENFKEETIRRGEDQELNLTIGYPKNFSTNELLETIQAYKEQCVGMAANMIGYLKTMMVVLDENKYLILINPVILKTSGKTYQTEEGCLSLQGVRKTQRYESIKVSYLDQDFKKKIKTFKGYTAQIIQHELDHFEGKII